MKKILTSASLFLFSALGAIAYGQDIPAVTGPVEYRGFGIPDVPGTLTFSLSATESSRSGYYSSGRVYATTLSGDVAYLSRSTLHPFSMTFAGGYSYITSVQQSSPFVNLTLSKTFGTRNWTATFTNSTRYLPEAPVSGLSGLPGLGDQGIPFPTTGGIDILTPYSQRVIEDASVSLDRKITGSTDLTGSGNFALQRFIDVLGPSNDYNQYGGMGGVHHRINALNDITASYDFTKFSYLDANFSFISQGASIQYARQWTRRFNTSLAAGPQVHSNSLTGGSTLDYSADLNANYILQRGSLSASYTKGVQGGSGVTQGASAQTVRGTYSHRLGEYANVDANVTYAKHNQLFAISPFAANTVSAGAQISRTLGTNFSVYGSYTAQHQSARGTIVNNNAFSGLSQTIAVGLTYSPRPIHLGN